MQPPSTPPESARGIWLPLLLNAGLFLLLYNLARALPTPAMGTGANPRDVAYGLFFLELGQCLLNGVLATIFALLRKWRWVIGWAVSALLTLLIGLGSCGYTLTHLA